MSSKFLPHNLSALDRVIRVILGVALVAIVFVGPKTPWGWVGLVLLFTTLVSSCPVYTLFGWSTCPVHDRG